MKRSTRRSNGGSIIDHIFELVDSLIAQLLQEVDTFATLPLVSVLVIIMRSGGRYAQAFHPVIFFCFEREDISMMRKIVCIAALAAALAFPTDSMARRGGGGGGFHGGGARGFHGGGVHRGFHGGVHRGAVVHRGVVVGGRGRYWHGRYYGYGVGPCWRNDYGAWVWICN